jgi:hypothetical protein
MLYLDKLGELLDRMDNFSAREEIKVTYFGYRKSHLSGKLLAQLPRSIMRDFENCLAARAGADPDNHVGYLIELNGETLYVHCGDMTMWFATGYELGD